MWASWGCTIASCRSSSQGETGIGIRRGRRQHVICCRSMASSFSYSAGKSCIHSVQQEGEPQGAAVMPRGVLQCPFSLKTALTGYTR